MKLQLIVIAFILSIAGSAFASFSSTYDVTVNTGNLGLSGQSGYLYLVYGQNGGVASTATVSSFTTGGGSLGAQDTVDVVNGSAVTGTLPGSVVFANTNSVNDYNQAITLGSTINFLLTFNSNSIPGSSSGPFGSSTGASTFSLSLYADQYGNTALVNSNGVNNSVPGEAIAINLNDNGTTSVTPYVAQATATPIPAAAYLFGSGLLGLVGIRRKIIN